MSCDRTTRHRTPLTSRCGQRWVAWRRGQLLHAGFDGPTASELAATRDVDLHALLDLVARGCPPRLAVRILAPTNGTDPRPLP